MSTATLEKTLDPKGMRKLESAFEELREEFEDHKRYMKAFLVSRKEKSISLLQLTKKYHLSIPRRQNV